MPLALPASVRKRSRRLPWFNEEESQESLAACDTPPIVLRGGAMLPWQEGRQPPLGPVPVDLGHLGPEIGGCAEAPQAGGAAPAPRRSSSARWRPSSAKSGCPEVRAACHGLGAPFRLALRLAFPIDEVFKSQAVKVIRLPYRRPVANSIAERFVGTCRREVLDHLLIFGRRHLEGVLREFTEHYHYARLHQGLGQRRPCEPTQAVRLPTGPVDDEIVSAACSTSTTGRPDEVTE